MLTVTSMSLIVASQWYVTHKLICLKIDTCRYLKISLGCGLSRSTLWMGFWQKYQFLFLRPLRKLTLHQCKSQRVISPSNHLSWPFLTSHPLETNKTNKWGDLLYRHKQIFDWLPIHPFRSTKFLNAPLGEATYNLVSIIPLSFERERAL